MRWRLLSVFAAVCVTWTPMATAQTASTPQTATTPTPEAAPTPRTATIASAVTVRAGPGTYFPSVTWLLSGTNVVVVGCAESWRWCDIIAGSKRGWVYSRYIAYVSGGSTSIIRDGGPGLGLPEIEFSPGEYWAEHYGEQSWLRNQAQLKARWERRRPPDPWRPPARVGAK